MTNNTDPARAQDELRMQAALLRTPEFMAQFDTDKFAGQLERIAAALDGSVPQRYDIDADPNGIRADVTGCVRAALYCGANNVNPPPEDHWLRDFWLIGRAEASRQDDIAANRQELPHD